MNEIKVPMPQRPSFVRDDDVSVSVQPRQGVRFNFDIDAGVLSKIGAEAVAHATDEMGRTIAYRHQHEVAEAVAKLLRDEEWARPIIRDAIRSAVREQIRGMFASTEEDE